MVRLSKEEYFRKMNTLIRSQMNFGCVVFINFVCACSAHTNSIGKIIWSCYSLNLRILRICLTLNFILSLYRTSFVSLFAKEFAGDKGWTFQYSRKNGKRNGTSKTHFVQLISFSIFPNDTCKFFTIVQWKIPNWTVNTFATNNTRCLTIFFSSFL